MCFKYSKSESQITAAKSDSNEIILNSIRKFNDSEGSCPSVESAHTGKQNFLKSFMCHSS
jgi:hypothetical protein